MHPPICEHYVPQIFKIQVGISFVPKHCCISTCDWMCTVQHADRHLVFLGFQTRKMHFLLSLLFLIGKIKKNSRYSCSWGYKMGEGIEMCMAIMVTNLCCVKTHNIERQQDGSDSGRRRFKEDTDKILVVTAASVTSSSISRTSLNKICEIGLHHSGAVPTFYPQAPGCLYCSHNAFLSSCSMPTFDPFNSKQNHVNNFFSVLEAA